MFMANDHDMRQAAALFERRLELLPGDASAELDLAKVFVDSGQIDKAMEMIRKLRSQSRRQQVGSRPCRSPGLLCQE